MKLTKKLEDNDLECLPGLGPATRSKLNRIGINRVSDIILFLPSFLIDKTKLSIIDELENGHACLLIGKITKVIQTKSYKPNLILTVDVGGENVQIRFLHKIIVYSYLKIGFQIRFSGIVRIKGRIKELIHPEVEVVKDITKLENIVPYYKTKKIISQNKLRGFIKYALLYVKNKKGSDVFTDEQLKEFKIPHYIEALENCHFPSANSFLEAHNLYEISKKRFVLEELLAYKIILTNAKSNFESYHAENFTIDEDKILALIKSLEYELTDSQKNAVNDIKKSFSKSYPTKRLIQGDVGSGKTIITVIASYIASLSSLQTAVLVPTEILADQHIETFKKILDHLHINIQCLKSNMSLVKKKQILASLSDGNIDIVIGTHSLITRDVVFKNLGLVVVDEQHKFGTDQRLLLTKKNLNRNIKPHELYLSATPIPRSLSLVLYEGIDYTIMKDLPQRRKRIITRLIHSDERSEINTQITNIVNSGEQVYWICSCINMTENSEIEHVKGLYESLIKIFPHYNIKMLHGRIDSKDNTHTMEKFINAEINILVCTTMIEVGLDVPNATCIVIEDPERFGLSQLHQLRGRVGRGSKQSYCYLIHKDLKTESSINRLKTMERFSNGFMIAEEDLKLRGAGEYLGTKQSGMQHNFKLATPEDVLKNYDNIYSSLKSIKLLSKESSKKLTKRWGRDSAEDVQL